MSGSFQRRSDLFAQIGTLDSSILDMPSYEQNYLRPTNFAKEAVDAIYDEISGFESALDEEHESGMSIVGGPAGVCLHVRKVYRYGSDKLVFDGINTDGSPLRLMQHLSQLNFLMISAKKIGETASRIGFHTPKSDIEE